MLLTEVRFEQVVQTAKLNVRTALGLIAIHSEKPVKGRQPRASLNPFTVVAAVGSWERFIADLTSAAVEANWHGPGGHKSAGSHWPDSIDGRMTRLGLLQDRVTTRWEAKFPANGWIGVKPLGWRTILQASPAVDRRALLDYVAETRRTRNGAAHYALLQNALESIEQTDQDGGYLWESDAKHPSLQSGYARGVTAVFLPLIDCTAVLVAQDQGRQTEPYRLPEDWFQAQSRTDRFAGVQFWAGTTLHRIQA
jgi:hypothetical protein